MKFFSRINPDKTKGELRQDAAAAKDRYMTTGSFDLRQALCDAWDEQPTGGFKTLRVLNDVVAPSMGSDWNGRTFMLDFTLGRWEGKGQAERLAALQEAVRIAHLVQCAPRKERKGPEAVWTRVAHSEMARLMAFAYDAEYDGAEGLRALEPLNFSR